MSVVWLGGIAVLDVDPVGVPVAIEARKFQEASQLLPHGPIWPREPHTETQKFTRALARTFSRADVRVQQLRREFFVDTADESLDAWEEFADLPGDCENPPTTLQGRRDALVAKLYRSRGPLTRVSFEAIAGELGYTVVEYVRTYAPFKMGSAMGHPMAGHPGGWQFAQKIVVSGSSDLDATFLCIIDGAKHLHLAVFVEIIP